MKTLCKRSLGVILTLLLMVGMVCAGGYSVIAADTDKESSGGSVHSAEGHTIYFMNNDNWSRVSCYMWNNEQGDANNASWPGEAMTDEGDGVWSYDIKGDYNMVIFNNGSGSKTLDLDYPGDCMIYDNGFKEYDTNPLKVKAFESSVASPQYIGSSIVFTAAAKSDGSVIEYQFSVNGTVTQNYSTNSTFTWNPVSTGEYTIKLDVKDNIGNTNTKELTYEIKDPSNELKPIFLSSSPATKTQIKTGATTNISVNAAGGNTGTKLLFYKFVVKDPNNTQINTAYYTLNKNYSFTPTVAGNYTVEVSVQSSDNTTITQKLTYESTGTVTTTSTTTSTTSTVPTGLLGDVDNSGIVDVGDATLIQKYVNHKPVNNFLVERADYDKTGRIDIRDVTAIQKSLLG
ncbi:MAG: starch-binding protein [Ruminococcus sp.]|nr:starch-binding protein [Ruminococcus sp.]